MKFEILIGMIASGKTTYAKYRAKNGAMIVSHDDLTEMLHGEYTYSQELKAHYLTMMRSIAYYALAAGRDVIIDRTHLSAESRKHWIDYARMIRKFESAAIRGPVQIVAVTFPVHPPTVHATRRYKADARGRSFWEWNNAAFHHFDQAQETPLDWRAEGFDECKEITEFQEGENPCPDSSIASST